MADLQDEIRKLEEERKKRITEEKRQQELDIQFDPDITLD